MNSERILKSAGIKLSYQRLRIFRFMYDNKEHPSVDMIHKALLPEIPTLSKTTIYNTLHLFVEKKVVRILNFSNYEVRYDADISKHSHFVCKHCDSIYDLQIDHSDLSEQIGDEFIVYDTYYYVIGSCSECKKIN